MTMPTASPTVATDDWRDPLAVVDGSAKVYSVENLCVADGSIMPRITTGNTMAPRVVIGERAADEIKAEHRLANSVGE
jgi:choline dehydrogenase